MCLGLNSVCVYSDLTIMRRSFPRHSHKQMLLLTIPKYYTLWIIFNLHSLLGQPP